MEFKKVIFPLDGLRSAKVLFPRGVWEKVPNICFAGASKLNLKIK